MNKFINAGLIEKTSNEYLTLNGWIVNLQLLEHQTIELQISIWYSDMFSQGLVFCCSNDHLLVMASDDFWQINEDGEKWAEDGTWYFYSSEDKHPDKDFKSESFENMETLFKRLINGHIGSEQLKVQLFVGFTDNFDLDGRQEE